MANVGNTCHYFYINQDKKDSPVLNIRSVMPLGFKVPQLVISDQHVIGYFTQVRSLSIDMNTGFILEHKYQVEKSPGPWEESQSDLTPWVQEDADRLDGFY